MRGRAAAMLLAVMGFAGTALAQDEPPAVHADQLGFLRDGPKRAIVASAAAAPLGWTLAAGDQTLASGTATRFGRDPQSGDTVQLIELPRAIGPGAYTLRVDGAAPLAIQVTPHLFAPLASAALNYFYQTRAGIAIEARYADGAQWARPAGHSHEIAPCFSGKDERGNDWPGCDYSLDVTGGWYDAGDQGKYVVNGGIAAWTLQNLYEEQQLAGHGGYFAHDRARLPEAGNGVNDLLDEARWEMEFLLRMQVPEGKHLRLPVGVQPRGARLAFSDVDASGMAHQKVADRVWTPLPTAPADDPQPRLLYPPTTGATLNLAATAAQCARLWRAIDSGFARRCATAAERAFAAALRNPEIYASNSFTGSGGYGDADLSDEFFWAASELYVSTGRAVYAQALRRMRAFTAPLTEPNWGAVAPLGTITLATVPNGLSPAEKAQQRALIVAAADRFLAEAARSGYHIPYASSAFTWGSNGGLLNRAIVLGIAERLTHQRRYRDGMIDVMDYLLGRNPLGRSFVTGFGSNPVQHPHHRFWAHQLDPRYPPPPPGVLSGGPNSTAMTDTISSTMRGKCVGMRCWVDEPYAFTMNEVAINWNAPLVWVAADLDAEE